MTISDLNVSHNKRILAHLFAYLFTNLIGKLCAKPFDLGRQRWMCQTHRFWGMEPYIVVVMKPELCRGDKEERESSLEKRRIPKGKDFWVESCRMKRNSWGRPAGRCHSGGKEPPEPHIRKLCIWNLSTLVLSPFQLSYCIFLQGGCSEKQL